MEFSNPIYEVLSIIFSVFALHGIYLSLVLLIKRRKDTEVKLLAVLLISVSFYLIGYIVFITEFIIVWPHLLGVSAPATYLMGPACYLFLKLASDHTKRLQWLDLVHLIPFLYILWSWFPVYGYDQSAKLLIIENIYHRTQPALKELLIMNSLNLLLLGYAIAGFVLIKRACKKVQLISPRMRALKSFSWAFLLIVAANILMPLSLWLIIAEGALVELLLLLIFAAAIHILGYNLINGKSLISLAYTGEKYATSPLNPDQISYYSKLLLEYFDINRPWKNPELNLKNVQNSIGIPSHYISRTLSEGLHCNFYSFVNNYRIEEILKRLDSDDLSHYSIQGIALDCGFKSASTFHRVFKEKLGLTPLQYLQSRRKPKKSRTGID